MGEHHISSDSDNLRQSLREDNRQIAQHRLATSMPSPGKRPGKTLRQECQPHQTKIKARIDSLREMLNQEEKAKNWKGG